MKNLEKMISTSNLRIKEWNDLIRKEIETVKVLEDFKAHLLDEEND